MRRKAKWKVYGPYEERGGKQFRIRILGPMGQKQDDLSNSREEAEAKAEALRRAVVDGKTMGELIREYETHLLTRGNKSCACKPDTAKLTKHVLRTWFDEEAPVCSIFREDVENAYLQRAQKTSAGTHRNELIKVKTFWRWALKKRIVTVSPAELVEPTGELPRGKEQLRDHEAALFAAKALEMANAGNPGALSALLALFMGLRSGEIRALRVRDVSGSVLWVAAEGGKTKAATRRLEIPEQLVSALARKTAGRDPMERLFPSPSVDGMVTKGWVSDWVERVCKAAGVPVVCPHGLRGTHATLAEDAGVSSRAVASALGHTSHTVTQRHYLESGTMDRARARRVAGQLSGISGKLPGPAVPSIEIVDGTFPQTCPQSGMVN